MTIVVNLMAPYGEMCNMFSQHDPPRAKGRDTGC